MSFRRDRGFGVSALQGRLSTSSQSQCSTDPSLIAGTWHRPLFLTRDRWFESGSLQQRVGSEPHRCCKGYLTQFAARNQAYGNAESCYDAFAVVAVRMSALRLSAAIRPSIPWLFRIAANSERRVATSLIAPSRQMSEISQLSPLRRIM